MGEEIRFRIPKRTGLLLVRSIYDAINQESFNGTMPTIPLRIRKLDGLKVLSDYRPGAFFTVEERHFRFSTIKADTLIDHSYTEERISISVDGDTLYFTDISDFFLNMIYYLHHEMIHEYCYLLGINDCNHDTQYHNAQFMIAAEEHGLVCDYDEKYGFHQTSIQSEMFYRILDAIPDETMKEIYDNVTAIYVNC